MRRLFLVLFVFSLSKLIGQNTIGYYIEQAKTHHPFIRDNQNQSKINLLEIERLRAANLKPQVSFNASYLFSPIISFDNNKARLDLNSKGSDNYYGLDLGSTNGGNLQAMFNYTQPLWMTEKFKPIAAQLLIANRINENNIEITYHDIEKNVIDQYITCLFDLKQVEYIKSIIALIDEQYEIVRKLAVAALAKQSDLILLNIERQKQIINLTTFQTNYRRDFLDLNLLCGIKDTAIKTLPPLSIKSALDSVFLKNDTLQSKFVEKFRLDSLNALASQDVFELKYKPQIAAFANGGLNTNYIPDVYKRFGWSAGISFNISLYDGGQKNINRSKTDLAIQTTNVYKERFLNQNSVRKTRILNEIQVLQDRQNALNLQIQEYQKLLEAYKKEIIRGQISVINFVMTLKDFTTLQQDFITIQTQQQSLINAYNYWNW